MKTLEILNNYIFYSMLIGVFILMAFLCIGLPAILVKENESKWIYLMYLFTVPMFLWTIMNIVKGEED